MPKDILSELGYTYGSLNPIQKKKSQPIYSTNSDPLEILRKEMADRFKNDGMKGVTRFKAIVLRIENQLAKIKSQLCLGRMPYLLYSDPKKRYI